MHLRPTNQSVNSYPLLTAAVHTFTLRLVFFCFLFSPHLHQTRKDIPPSCCLVPELCIYYSNAFQTDVTQSYQKCNLLLYPVSRISPDMLRSYSERIFICNLIAFVSGPSSIIIHMYSLLVDYCILRSHACSPIQPLQQDQWVFIYRPILKKPRKRNLY